MLRGGDVHGIQAFKRQGLSIQQISQLTGYDRKTVRKYLRHPTPPHYGPRAPRPTKLDPYKAYLDARLQAGVWNAVVLFGELHARGYCGGYTAIKDYLRPKRQAAMTVAVRRFETPPGQPAQVDWGILGDIAFPDGTKRTLSGFIMTLGYSRAMFADIATDQTLGTLLRLHEAAFAYLGGVPYEILYDRIKTVVLGLDARGETQWQPIFADFSQYWGFVPRWCRAYRPQTKGKVERGIGYLRQNFLCGRNAANLDDLRHQLAVWTTTVANHRVHGTTHRVVQEAWQEEQAVLPRCDQRGPYPVVIEQVRRVSRDAYVTYQANRYSVPWHAAGKEVVIREVGAHLEIWRDTQQLARHVCCPGRHQIVTIAAHHATMPTAQRQQGKMRISLKVTVPQVEVRSLAVYAALAEETVA